MSATLKSLQTGINCRVDTCSFYIQDKVTYPGFSTTFWSHMYDFWDIHVPHAEDKTVGYKINMHKVNENEKYISIVMFIFPFLTFKLIRVGSQRQVAI